MVSFLKIQNWAKQIYDEDNGYFGGRTQDSWSGNGIKKTSGNGIKKTSGVLGKLFLDLNSDYNSGVQITHWTINLWLRHFSLCVIT